MIRPLPPGVVVSLSTKAQMLLRVPIKNSGTVRYIVTALSPSTWDVSYYTNRNNAIPEFFKGWEARKATVDEFSHLPFFNSQAATADQGFHADYCSVFDLHSFHGVEVKRDDYFDVRLQHKDESQIPSVYLHEATLAKDSCMCFLLDANKVPLGYISGPMGDQLNYLDSWLAYANWLINNNYWDHLPVIQINAKPFFDNDLDHELFRILKWKAQHPRDPDIHDMIAEYKQRAIAAAQHLSKQVDMQSTGYTTLPSRFKDIKNPMGFKKAGEVAPNMITALKSYPSSSASLVASAPKIGLTGYPIVQ